MVFYICPVVSSLIELELEFRVKNEQVSCHETQRLISKFKALGQPVTLDVRSMTQ